jgi:hypothetical protein
MDEKTPIDKNLRFQSFFVMPDLIPAEYGIFDRHHKSYPIEIIIDSGFRRNDV